MTRHEQLQEQYEEALFALLMDDLAVAQGEEALEENEALQADPAAAVPELTSRRCLRTINRHYSAQTARSMGRVTGKLINRVALIALLGGLLFTTAFAASSTFRSYTLDYFYETFDDRKEFHAIVTESSMPQSITLSWLPDDYALADKSSGFGNVNMIHQTSSGKKIQLIITLFGGSGPLVDTEDAEVTTVTIQGYEAMTAYKEGLDVDGEPYQRSMVVWVDTERGLFIEFISDDESVETLVQVAEGLVLE